MAANVDELLESMDKTHAGTGGSVKGLAYIGRFRGNVAQGYGRGGKKLGVPTANLPASLFQDALKDVKPGVYFGWSSIADVGFAYKTVMNVGLSPTFEGQENSEKIIEAHLILDEGETFSDFYGVPLRIQLLGFIRDEKKFGGLEELKSQIVQDITVARDMLDESPYLELKQDQAIYVEDWIGSDGGDMVASWEFKPMRSAIEAVLADKKEQLNAVDAEVEKEAEEVTIVQPNGVDKIGN